MIGIAFGGAGRPWAVTVALTASLLIGTLPAQAEVGGPPASVELAQPVSEPGPPSPPGAAAAVAGALTALVPLAIGGALVAEDDRPDRQRAGTYVLLGGLAAAPWVAQGGAGRWKRALVYGLGSLALSTGAALTMRTPDVYDPDLANHERLPFVLLLTSAFISTAASIVDSFVVSSLRSGGAPLP